MRRCRLRIYFGVPMSLKHIDVNWREQQRKTKGRKQTDVVWESAKCGTADNFAQQAEESMGINLWEKSLGPGETIPGRSIVFPGNESS